MASPVEVFQGYNSVSGSTFNPAVAGSTKTTGIESIVRCEICETTEKLCDSLEINQSLSVSFGPFDSIDEKMRFFKSLNVTTHCLSIVLYAKKIQSTVTALDYTLKDPFPAKPSSDDLLNFFLKHGDTFVCSTTYGGEYRAVYVFYTQTSVEQQNLQADLKGKGIFSGVIIDAQLQANLNQYLATTNTRWSLYQAMSGLTHTYPTPDQLINFALQFPGMNLPDPVVVNFETKDYGSVIGVNFQPINNIRTYFVGGNQVGGLTYALVNICQILTQIGYIKDIYTAFDPDYLASDTTLIANETVAMHDRDGIRQQMSNYCINPLQQFPPIEPQSIINGIPCLQYDVQASPEYGGVGGYAWSDVTISTFIPNKMVITAIEMRSEERIDCLTITYAPYGVPMGTPVSHGGSGGVPSQKLQLDPTQRIRLNAITGSIAMVATKTGPSYRVGQLTFTTSIGTSISGGQPTVWGFSRSVVNGQFILGFQGRSAVELDQIQVVYANFKPAIWTPIPFNVVTRGRCILS